MMFFRLRGERFLPTRQAHKRVDTKVSTLLRITHFLRGHGADCRHVTAVNRGTAEKFFFRVFRNVFAASDRLLLHRWFTLRRARHSSAAQLVCALCRKAPAKLSGLCYLSS